ncbi:erythromycin esterase family protein [Pseudoalteromonas sp. MTN2-4]|uniref:erythromycin esterase family protein n=1 Tax=Pseudoalteromonas sp. MTN2-4 TaxID=3056555 RepID=UPI0036F1A49F
MNSQLKHFAIFATAIFMFGCGGGGSTTQNDSAAAEVSTSTSTGSVNTPAYEQYVVTHAMQLDSLTDNNNTSDLDQITAHFNDKRIVQLGESTHGSKQMNQIKTRIIKYLHQNHDYNVVAFESSMFSCNLKLETNIKTAQPLLTSCAFPIWHSDEVLELFDYIIETQSTDRPLKLAGYDVQFSSGDYPASSLHDYYEQIITQNQLTPSFDLTTHLQQYINTGGAGLRCRDNNISDNEQCEQFEDAYLDAVASLELITQYFESLGNDFVLPAAIAKSQHFRLLMLKADIEGGVSAGMKARDTGMAENFITLAEHMFPNDKVIIWAHNFHISESYPSQYYQDKFMGALLNDYYSDELYTVGIYMLSGESGDNNRGPIPVTAHQSDSLESIVQATSLAPLFLPLSKENQSGNSDDWLHTQTRAKEWGQGNTELVLSDSYDALIVIETSSLPDYLN